MRNMVIFFLLILGLTAALLLNRPSSPLREFLEETQSAFFPSEELADFIDDKEQARKSDEKTPNNGNLHQQTVSDGAVLRPFGSDERGKLAFTQTSLPDKEKPYAYASRLFAQERYPEVRKLILAHKHLIEKQTPEGVLWANLLVEMAVLQKDTVQLQMVWNICPQSIRNNQEAALLLAESFVNSLNYDEYFALRKSFVGKKDEDSRWVFLDVDKLLFDGKREDAISLLQSEMFEGNNEITRLVALAKLNMASKPQAAWDYLQRANAAAPHDSDIALLQAKILEMSGKFAAAQERYEDACYYSPGSNEAKGQLALFYIRKGDFLHACQTFQAAFLQGDSDLCIQALFWSKVSHPMRLDTAHLDTGLPDGRFAAYLVELKPWEFWNEARYGQEAHPHLRSSSQAAMWLQLLHYLRQGEEKKALSFIEKEAVVEESWDPGLLIALGRTLSIRQKGNFSSVHPVLHKDRLDRTALKRQQQGRAIVSKIAFAQDETEIDQELYNLMQKPQIWSYLLIDAGWNKAGIDIDNSSNIADGMPLMLQEKLIAAVREIRGEQSTLAFLDLLDDSDEIVLTKGKIYFAQSKYERAAKEFEKIAHQPNAFGKEASLSLAKVYLEKGDLAKARNTIEFHHLLGKSMEGKELYARIALKENNQELAEKIYHEIEKDSLEAKSYFAMRAFEQKQWQKAYDYTLELLRHFPTSKTLQENLRKIERKLQSSFSNNNSECSFQSGKNYC